MYRRLMTRDVGIYCRNENCDRKCGMFHVRSAGATNNRKGKKRSVNGQSQVATSHSLDTNWKRASLQPSPSSTVKSFVTLDEIMESAKRKISEDFTEAPMPPSPEVADLVVPTFPLTPRMLKKKSVAKKVNRPADELYNPFDSDSDEGGFVSAEPPTQIDEDDFEGILKATAPPADAYSNPTLYKTSDPLVSHLRRYSIGDDHYSIDFSTVDLSSASVVMSLDSEDDDNSSNAFSILRHKLNDQLTPGTAAFESDL